MPKSYSLDLRKKVILCIKRIIIYEITWILKQVQDNIMCNFKVILQYYINGIDDASSGSVMYFQLF